MAQFPIDPINQRILLGTREAAAVAVERARQTGTPLIVWRDGKVCELSPDDPSLRHISVVKEDANKGK